MNQRCYKTPYGTITYWVTEICPERRTLVFLPGLTADHRLFDKQIAFFQDRCNLLVWDAPGHASSRPFELHFSLMDKARWLHDILQREQIISPVLIGQSMGGYVAQAYLEQFPTEVSAIVSIDSAPLQREYITGIELWLLKHIEPVYRIYPWKSLVKAGCAGCACSEYGQTLMKAIMEVYSDDIPSYCRLIGHGYRILAEAIEANLPYKITCPAILICGERDQAGSTKRYNKAWAKRAGLPIHWIAGAGHNSNTDRPEEVNAIIWNFLQQIKDP